MEPKSVQTKDKVHSIYLARLNISVYNRTHLKKNSKAAEFDPLFNQTQYTHTHTHSLPLPLLQEAHPSLICIVIGLEVDWFGLLYGPLLSLLLSRACWCQSILGYVHL